MRKYVSWILTGTLFVVVASWGVYQVFFTGADFSAPGASGKLSRPAGLLFPGTNPEQINANNQTGSGSTVVIANSSDIHFLGYPSQYGNLPTSLQGAEVPGHIQNDNKGNLRINRGVREMFDFFLAGISDESRDIALGRIKEYGRHKLDKDAALQADQILADYVAYKDYLAQQQHDNQIPTPNTADDQQAVVKTLREVMSSQMEARRRFMGSGVANAFFADDEAYDQYSLRKLEINADPHLSLQDKKDEINKLEEQFRKSSSGKDQ